MKKIMVIHPWWKFWLTFGEVGRWEDVKEEYDPADVKEARRILAKNPQVLDEEESQKDK